MINWHIGMKVVCIKGGGHFWQKDAAELEEGRIYTIRDMRLNPRSGELNLLLEEVRNLPRLCDNGDFGEPYYGAVRFRPVQTRATDISIFTQMLVPSKDKVQA